MNNISSNTIKTLTRQIISLIIQLITIIIIARTLGVEENGKYAIIILLPKFISMILSLGIASSNIYFIAKKECSITTIYTTSLLLSSFIAIIGFFLGSISLHYFSNLLFPNIGVDILFLALFIFPSSFLFLIQLSFIQAKENFNDYNILSLTNPILFLIFILFLVLIHEMTILTIIYVSIITPLISFFISFFYTKRNGYTFIYKNYSKKYLYLLLSYGLRSHASNIVAFITYRTDLFLLNLMLNSLSVGLYSIAVQIVERLWIISGVLSTVLFPRFVSMKNDQERLSLISKSFKTAILSTTLISIGILLFGYYFIGLLFGDEYLESYYAIVFLLPGVILGAGSSIVANSISAYGKPELNMYTSVVEMILNVILNIILIPIYGFIGAAIATSISYSVNMLLKVILFKKIEPLFDLKTLLIAKSDILYLLKTFKNVIKGNK